MIPTHMNDNSILNLNCLLEETIKDTLYIQFYDRLSVYKEFESLAFNLKKLENRSREYKNPSFLILVVGPVKSGKSTFVNLVAKSYVSPTHFLECTVRPSFISSSRNEQSLTVYRSRNSEMKAEQMDSILSCINGLIERQEIVDVDSQVYELTNQNIDKYVRLDPIGIVNDDIIMTAIKTKGGILLQDNVFLVDMAGFDGANVNLDTPTYKTIVERADLILFVQSSNSAISKVSSNFFNLLQAKNNTVPVCLVHNVFESAYWRSDQSKKLDIEEQKQYAVTSISTNYKLSLHKDNAYNINLGKVDDWFHGNYRSELKEVLEKEAAEFEKVEENIHNLLLSQRNSIRLKNCLARTELQLEVLLKKVNELCQNMQNKHDEYIALKKSFADTKKKVEQFNIPSVVSVDKNEIFTKIGQIYDMAKMTNVASNYKTSEARSFVSKFLLNVHLAINDYFRSKLTKFKDLVNAKEIVGWITDINTLSVQSNVKNSMVQIEYNIPDKMITFTPDISIERLIPNLGLFRRHSKEDVNGYLKHIKDILCGFQGEISYVKGYVEVSLYPEMENILSELHKETISSIITSCNSEIERLMHLALYQLIEDIDNFKSQEQMLIDLKNSIVNIVIPNYE